MKVRRAGAADSRALTADLRAVYEELALPGTKTATADLRDVGASYAAFLVAELNGRIVGTAGLTAHPTRFRGRARMRLRHALADATAGRRDIELTGLRREY